MLEAKQDFPARHDGPAFEEKMRRLVATPLIALVVLLALGAAAPVVASAEEPLFGAWNPGDPYMGHTDGANALEAATRRRVEIVHWYQGWGGGAFGAPVQPQSMEAVARSGYIF